MPKTLVWALCASLLSLWAGDLSAATITLPGVTLSGTITRTSTRATYGYDPYGPITGGTWILGTLSGENGFQYSHEEGWPIFRASYILNQYVSYGLLPVADSIRLAPEDVILPWAPLGSPGSGSISVTIGSDRYVIPVGAYVSYQSGSRLDDYGNGYTVSTHIDRTLYSPVPEPATMSVAGLCLGALFFAKRRLPLR